MKKLNFAIIGPQTQNTSDLVDVIKKLSHDVEVFKMSDVTIETLNDKVRAFYKDKDILEFDIVIFRGYNVRILEAQFLAKVLMENGKTVIEEGLGNGKYVRGKMQQAANLFSRSIKHPPTFHADSIEGWNKILSKMSFPIIAKPIFGRKGRGVIKLNNFEEAKEFYSKNTNDYLAQLYFPIKSDFRIFVVGGIVIGGFQRFINEGEYKSNIHGTKAEKIEVNEEMKKIAIASAKANDYEIAGVDMFEYNKEHYVIEVNVAPQWEKFKAVTDINPAEAIIEYAIKKHLKN